MKKVFGFDLGKASIGYCVREGHNIKEVNSIIIEKEHSETTTNKNRKRVKRTIEAHKAREEFLNKLWTSCGLELLDKKDLRFTKEFPNKNEDTIYTSCLLRIALLQNKPLSKWQIYKALHNAIQRRGYDPNLPWKSIQTEDDKENLALIEKYTKENEIELIKNEEFQFPCYYDALRLGLWDENNPYDFKKAITIQNENKVRSTKYVAPRVMVEKELILLWHNAKKQITELQNISEEEFLYGKFRESYGSYKNSDYKKDLGTNKDREGVLSQKIPRFDNRIIAKCKLLPKRNVCKANTIENVSFTLLKKLKDLRFTDVFGEKHILSPIQIAEIYEKWKKKADENGKLDATVIKKDIENVTGLKILDKIAPIKANITGRSSFCKRACLIMIKIIVSGIDPMNLEIDEFIDKEGTINGIFEDEIKEMLQKIGNWENLYIPDNRNENLECDDERIKTDIIIGGITNPIVRNRLQIFRDLLINLKNKYGKPDEIIFEFIRDGADNSLSGRIKALDAERHIKENEKENELIRKELEEANILSAINFEKMKLLKIQGGKCIYSGKPISPSDFDLCEIDHIVPRSKGGSDALNNKVLCYRIENQNKKDRTPYEWLSSDDEIWTNYVNRMNEIKDNLGKKKFEFLTSKDCIELMESYNGLAETSHIARIAQQIAAHIFNWGQQTKGQERHIFVNNGQITASIRRQYRLNSLLGDDKKKNRENDKHHALDSICISYSRDFKYDKETKKDKIEGFNPNEIKKVIDEIIPYPYTNKKPLKSNTNPLETIYGKRIIDDKAHIVQRVSIETLDKKKVPNIVDDVIKNDLLNKIDLNQKEWQEMLKNYIHPLKRTKVKKVLITVSLGIIELDKNGREHIGEYADFGTKGTLGQFKCSKGHKGQILYYNEKGAIKVIPLFSNKNTDEIKEKLLNMNCKLYKKGMVFYSGCLLNIPNDFMGGQNTYPKGIYKLRTLRADGMIKLENNNGIEIMTSASNLVKADFEKLKS